jgi:oligopeptide transport system permease protein
MSEAATPTAEQATRGTSLGKDAWRRFKKNRLAMFGLVVVTLMALLGLSAPWLSRHVTGFSYDEQHPELRLNEPGSSDISKDFPSYDSDLAHFGALDRNRDGQLAGKSAAGERELGELYWTARFGLFAMTDYDLVSPGETITDAVRRSKPVGAHPDRQLTAAEWPEGYDQLDDGFRDEFTAWVGARTPEGQDVIAAARTFWIGLGLDRAAAFDRLDLDDDGAVDLRELTEFRRPYRPFESPDAGVAAMDADQDGAIAKAEYPGAPVTRTFWLGTDQLGRCVLTRLLYGAGISIGIGLAATLVSFVIGVLWGAVAGYYGGRVDGFMMRIVDVLYGLPFMFIVILLMIVFGRSTINLFIALGAVQWLTMSRVVRGQILSLKHREFVEAAIALGVPRRRIVWRHLLRNTVGPVIVYATLMVPAVILEEAFLSFLGLGVQPPNPSWGTMITDGVSVIDTHPWLILYPGLVLSLTLFCMNFVGDGIRDALDPQGQRG